MKASKDPDFGATGQFELTGVYVSDRKADATFATTLGMDRIKSLLLLGAGEAHLRVLAQLAKHSRSDLDVTLITPWSYKTSAALARGYVAGQHSLAACQIDLEPLLQRAGVRWISARCNGLDARTSSVMLDYGAAGASVSGQRTSGAVGRPAMLTYDLLSIDTGTALERHHLDTLLPGAAEHAVLHKPTEQFVNRWAQILNQAKAHPNKPFDVCVIGAETAGLELCFAMERGLSAAGIPHRVHLVGQGRPLGAGYPPSVRKRVIAWLKKRQIIWHNALCTRVHAQHIDLSEGPAISAQLVVVATGDHTPEWLTHSGLARDGNGRVLVNDHLQSTRSPKVFATGGIAAKVGHLRQAGLRIDGEQAGPTLALNLLASLSDQPLNPLTAPSPKVRFLNCAGEHAIASWGRFSAEGRWAWRWKQRQDLGLVARYQR